MEVWLTKDNVENVQDPKKFLLSEQIQSIFAKNGFNIIDLVKKDHLYA